jgi:hypothetical protein
MISRYRINKTIEIFQNDKSFMTSLINNNIYPTDEEYRDLIILLLNNEETIIASSVESLNSFLRDDISNIFGLEYIEAKFYKQIIYTFKYSTIKNFFKENYYKFIPEYDFNVINSKEKLRLFTEAFLKEFDRFSDIIDEIASLTDVDKAPEDYLNYLAQAVGYEREDSKLLSDDAFRDLIKNIIEIYKIKGTNYSFELFFNFLGFSIELKEYWFDKRFGDDNKATNPETGVSDKNLYSFYLTENKPTDNLITGLEEKIIISENNLIETLDLNLFNKLISSGSYTYKQLLGYDSGYTGQPYTFFKTNMINYTLERIYSGEEETDLSAEDLSIIERYVNFLTPIFIQKNISVLATPFSEGAFGLIINDYKIKKDDGSFERMFHSYVGFQPSLYYWDNGLTEYNKGTYSGVFRNGIDGGGYFINNFFLDTETKIETILLSIASEFPTYTDEQVLEVYSQRLASGEIFGSDFPQRDILYPYLEVSANDMILENNLLDNYEANVPLLYLNGFSFLKGKDKRFSDALSEMNDYTVEIQGITKINGNGNSEIKINKDTYYDLLKIGETIKILYCLDFKNRGIYTISDMTEDGFYLYLELEESVNSNQSFSGGEIQIYRDDWQYKDFFFTFLFDRDLSIEIT